MPRKKKKAKLDVPELEAELEQSELAAFEAETKVIQINLDDAASKHLLEEYIAQDNEHQNAQQARGSFNEFIRQHERFRHESADTIFVAEISGTSVALGRTSSSTDNCVNIDGANFTGSRFVNVDIHQIKDVSFRDCVFENVRWNGTPAHEASGKQAGSYNVDFRGIRIGKCSFINWNHNHPPERVHLGFARPNVVQDIGVFTITDQQTLNSRMKQAQTTLNQAMEKEIGKYLDEQATKDGALKRLVGTLFAVRWAPTSKQREYINNLKTSFKNEQQDIREELTKECAIRFKDPVLDPTYTRGQSDERASAIKAPLKAVREDLETYLQTDRMLSFNDFMAEKHADVLKSMQGKHPDKMIVPVTTFVKEDPFDVEYLSQMNLSGLDLSGVDFSYCNMSACVLNGANLAGSCLEGVNLADATCKETNFTDCNMVGLQGAHASFEKAILIRVQLACAALNNANLDDVVAYEAVFRGANLQEARMSRADLSKADLSKANLSYADAQHAGLKQANLAYATADKAKLAHANLSEAVAVGLNASAVNLDHAIARDADFSDANLKNLRAEHADFERANLQQTNMESANLSHAILRKANIQRANLKGATIKSAQAEQMDARHAVLQGADLREANLSDADVKWASLAAANLHAAIVHGIKADVTTLLLDSNLADIKGD